MSIKAKHSAKIPKWQVGIDLRTEGSGQIQQVGGNDDPESGQQEPNGRVGESTAQVNEKKEQQISPKQRLQEPVAGIVQKQQWVGEHYRRIPKHQVEQDPQHQQWNVQRLDFFP